MSSMLKKCSTFFLMLFIASCAGTKLIQPESQKDASYQQAQLTNTRLAIVMLDSLQITYDRDISDFPVQRYRYYLKRQFPVAIRENTVFKDAALVYSIDNAADIQWKTESLPQVEATVTIPVPALSTRFDLPGGDYPFVLILSRLDIQHTGKNIKDRLTDVFDVSATGLTQHCLRYVLWDNRDGKVVQKGVTAAETIELEKYIGTQRWEQLMTDLAAQIFNDPIYQK